jgi:hypothetical protein
MSPNAGGRGEVCKVTANEYTCAHGTQVNFRDLTPYLIINDSANTHLSAHPLFPPYPLTVELHFRAH